MDCLQLVEIKNKAAMNIFMYVFWYIYKQRSVSAMYLWNDLLGHESCHVYVFDKYFQKAFQSGFSNLNSPKTI